MLADANTSAFLTHTNGILHAVPVPRRLEQSQLLEFQDKAADRRAGGVSETFFQLLGGKTPRRRKPAGQTSTTTFLSLWLVLEI